MPRAGARPQATAPALDAAELVGAALDALASDPELLAAERARVRHLLVDDAQDLDPQQMELVRALGRTARTVLLAGDPDQAVLGFRGADPAGCDAVDAPDGRAHRRPPGAARRSARPGRRLAARLPGAGPGRHASRRRPTPPAGGGRPRRRCACSASAAQEAGLDRRRVAARAPAARGAVVADGRAVALGPPHAARAAPRAAGRRRADRGARPTSCRWPASPRSCRC